MDSAEQSNREVVERFFAASEGRDLDELATLVDDEMVMEWPQSGERFEGRANVLGAMNGPLLYGSRATTSRVATLLIHLRRSLRRACSAVSPKVALTGDAF